MDGEHPYRIAVRAAPLLNDEQHRELLRKYKEEQDQEALELLVLSLGRLVLKQAYRIIKRSGGGSITIEARGNSVI